MTLAREVSAEIEFLSLFVGYGSFSYIGKSVDAPEEMWYYFSRVYLVSAPF